MSGDNGLDRIYIRDLFLRCVIGVNAEERQEKQDVQINIVIFADLDRACRNDRLEDSVNYKTLKKKVIRLVENSEFFLIEKLAAKIADLCLDEKRVQKVRVLVDKPGALRFARSVAVEIERQRLPEQDHAG